MHKINSSPKALTLATAILLTLAPNLALGQWKTSWSYAGDRGPSHWGALDPDYALCGSGRRQSPIDIEQTRKTKLPSLNFAYKAGPVRIVNNGYTAVRIDYDAGNGNQLVVDGKHYELTQFHFHRPSEETVDGHSYDMVIHLMHQASDGEVAAVAVFVTRGKENRTVAGLWRYMPAKSGASHVLPGVVFDPSVLIPKERGYYTYQGSQTAPPCTEGVRWFVLKKPLELSEKQIATFAKLYPHDVRPTQPLNGRLVEETP